MYAIDFTKLAGTTKLFLDFIDYNGPACQYFRYDFRQLKSYRQVVEQIDKTSYPREKLALVITKATSHLDLSPATKENIKRLARPDSLCVFAGQQVGLLLGPMYSVLKALTAYKLAKRLEAELGRPVIPCFWIATDDHDFDEIKSANLLDRDGQCRTVTYEPNPKPDGQPMSNVKLDSEIEKFISSVNEIMVDTEFSETIKKTLKKIYQPGKSLSASFTELFETIIGDFGIVPVDPNYSGMKIFFEPVFRRDIEHHDAVFDIFEKRSRELIEAGYHRQVHKPVSNLNLFFDNGIRRNIIVDGDSYRYDGYDKKYSRSDIMGQLKDDPDNFSPNVTLRPIVQSFAFPTVCQIVGPSEAAYFAQITPLFEYHGVPWPVIRPRLFATLLEPQVAKIIHKFSIDFASLDRDLEFEIGRVIGEKYPPEIQNQAELLRSQIENPLISLAESVKAQDLESYQALDHTRRKIDHELNHLSKKLFMAHKKRHDEVRRKVLKAAAFLLPCGKFQERVLTPIYFADKFGPDIFKLLESKLNLDSVGHQLVEIEP
jgi:bacillithiol synthase